MRWIGTTANGNYIIEATPKEWGERATVTIDPVILGAALREYRNTAGLTQQQAADKIGISRTYLSMIERGVTDNYSHVIYKKILVEISKGELP